MASKEPTRLYDNQNSLLAQNLMAPINLGPDTVLIDARSSFDYTMAHLPGALNLDWREFSSLNSSDSSGLGQDVFTHARRLSRLGIDINSKIVVIGKGTAGQCEEGRIAWLLTYLGVSNIHFVGEGYFSSGWTNIVRDPPLRPNVDTWKPLLKPHLLVEKRELKAAIKRDHPMKNVVLMDVRSSAEYLSDPKRIEAINIEWKEFFGEDLKIRKTMTRKLLEVGIKPEQRIIVISNEGLRSSCVTLALIALGFPNAGNFVAGMAHAP